MNLENALEDFLLEGLASGWSEGTTRTYRWHIARLIAWLAEHGAVAPDAITKRLLHEYAAGNAATWSPATRKGSATAIKTFLHWLHEEELHPDDLAAAVRIPAVPRQIQRTLSAQEVRKLLAAAAVAPEHGVSPHDAAAIAHRNSAIIAVLFDSMIRAHELCALKIADVDLEHGLLIVRHGKGGSGRCAPIGPDTADRLRQWLAVRPSTNDVVFVGIGGTAPGTPLTPAGLRLILRRIGERADVPAVSPHAFRRGGAVSCTLSGAPSRLVQLWGGWSDLKMLELYTQSLEKAGDAIAAYRPYSPVSAALNDGVTKDGEKR